MNEDAREALFSAAKEAKARGDIGKPGCVEVWDWLEYWAITKYPSYDYVADTGKQEAV
jgi:hypothetical protein